MIVIFKRYAKVNIFSYPHKFFTPFFQNKIWPYVNEDEDENDDNVLRYDEEGRKDSGYSHQMCCSR